MRIRQQILSMNQQMWTFFSIHQAYSSRSQ